MACSKTWSRRGMRFREMSKSLNSSDFLFKSTTKHLNELKHLTSKWIEFSYFTNVKERFIFCQHSITKSQNSSKVHFFSCELRILITSSNLVLFPMTQNAWCKYLDFYPILLRLDKVIFVWDDQKPFSLSKKS